MPEFMVVLRRRFNTMTLAECVLSGCAVGDLGNPLALAVDLGRRGLVSHRR